MSQPFDFVKAQRIAKVFYDITLAYTPFVLAGIVLFYRRRNMYPIKARAPLLSILTSVMVLVWELLYSIISYRLTTISCMAALVAGQFVILFMMAVMIVRSVWLYATYNHVVEQRKYLQLNSNISELDTETAANTAKAALAGQSEPKATNITAKTSVWAKTKQVSFPKTIKSTNWKWEDARTPQAISALVSAFVIIHVVQLAVVISITPNPTAPFIFCDLHVANDLTFFVLIIYACSIIFAGIKLRIVIEGVGIKRELLTVAIALITGLFTWYSSVLNRDFDRFSRTTFPIVKIVVALSDLTIHCAVIFFPLYRSWALEKNSPKTESVLNTGRESFVKLLETSKGFDAFYDFVTGEFSVENLICFRNLVDYKKRFPALRNKLRSSTRKRIECGIFNHALHIFVIHIAERSPLEVNLPGSVIDDVLYRLRLPRNFSSGDLVSKFLNSTRGSFEASMDDIPDSFLEETEVSPGLTVEIPEYVNIKTFEHFESDVPGLEDLYSSIYEVIVDLMFKDSFTRFVETPIFTELQKQSEETQAVKAAMVSLKIL